MNNHANSNPEEGQSAHNNICLRPPTYGRIGRLSNLTTTKRAVLPMIFIMSLLFGCISQSNKSKCDYSQFTDRNIDAVFDVCANMTLDYNKLHQICDKAWDKYPTFNQQYGAYNSCINKIVNDGYWGE